MGKHNPFSNCRHIFYCNLKKWFSCYVSIEDTSYIPSVSRLLCWPHLCFHIGCQCFRAVPCPTWFSSWVWCPRTNGRAHKRQMEVRKCSMFNVIKCAQFDIFRYCQFKAKIIRLFPWKEKVTDAIMVNSTQEEMAPWRKRLLVVSIPLYRGGGRE